MFGSAPFDRTKWLRNMLRRSTQSAADIASMPAAASIPATSAELLRIMFRAVTTLSV
jgi:hypothetical protein